MITNEDQDIEVVGMPLEIVGTNLGVWCRHTRLHGAH